MQICSASIEFTDEMKKHFQERIRDDIYGVSEQFVDDLMNILEKYKTDRIIFDDLPEALVSENTPLSSL